MNMIRLEKYLGEQGIMSRREAKRYIEAGKILINGSVAKLGQKIDPERDTIDFTSKVHNDLDDKITVAVYKPRGVLSSHDSNGKNIFDIFPQYNNLHTVGRLDKESEGLILLSNDGLVTRAVTNANHLIEKEYLVTVRESVLPWMMQKMSEGMELEDGWTLPAQAWKVGPNSFRIILKEGRKHQIRRMANACKLTIESLNRTRIHTIESRGMMPGNVKKLTPELIEDLKQTGA